MGQETTFTIIVVGTSQGGLEALRAVLSPLPADFPVPILVVRHQVADAGDYLLQALQKNCALKVRYGEAGEWPQPGTVYIAPPDRHLLLGTKGELQLSADKPVHFSRPAIDPLFKSAANCYGAAVLAVVLTGANSDGAEGVVEIKKKGGKVLVQDPESAETDTMPKAALAAIKADYIVWLDQIGPHLWTLTRKRQRER